MKKEDIRWQQRFQNFERAFKLLRSVVEEQADGKELNQLEKEGVIQRFNFTIELAWKTLKDKMESDGLSFELVSPKVVLKKAFQANYINDIEIWLAMVQDRNLMSHTYDFDTFEEVLRDIKDKYFTCLDNFYFKFLEASLNE